MHQKAIVSKGMYGGEKKLRKERISIDLFLDVAVDVTGHFTAKVLNLLIELPKCAKFFQDKFHKTIGITIGEI